MELFYKEDLKKTRQKILHSCTFRSCRTKLKDKVSKFRSKSGDKKQKNQNRQITVFLDLFRPGHRLDGNNRLELTKQLLKCTRNTPFFIFIKNIKNLEVIFTPKIPIIFVT